MNLLEVERLPLPLKPNPGFKLKSYFRWGRSERVRAESDKAASREAVGRVNRSGSQQNERYGRMTLRIAPGPYDIEP